MHNLAGLLRERGYLFLGSTETFHHNIGVMSLVEKAFISGKEAYLQANDKSKFERMKNDN